MNGTDARSCPSSKRSSYTDINITKTGGGVKQTKNLHKKQISILGWSQTIPGDGLHLFLCSSFGDIQEHRIDSQQRNFLCLRLMGVSGGEGADNTPHLENWSIYNLSR